MTDIFEKCRAYTAPDEMKKREIYPYFHELQSRQDCEVMMEGKRRIMLGSNNYLGLTVHPEVVEAGVRALEQYGSGCSGSRFLNGTLDLHARLEAELADFLGFESTLTFSTGFQTNLGILSALAGPKDVILCDRENHASIYDGCKLSYARMIRYRHNDMADLEDRLRALPEDCGKLIVTDGVFSMSGDIADLPGIVRLAKAYGARTMVDDAHGFGVLGEGGRGTVDHFGLNGQVDVVMGTFSKSLASLGGYMAADESIVNYVRHVSRPFIFCASIPPASCASALAALRVLKAHPELPRRLNALAAYFRDGLRRAGIAARQTEVPIIPIYTYDTVRTCVITKELFEAGVYVNPAIPPATPEGEALLRTSCTAAHTEAVLDEALSILKEVLDRHPEVGRAACV